MQVAEKKAIDTIRVLCADTVQKANSGHPGTPMAMAPLTYMLYNEVMRYSPANPLWPNRDRFVLSIGHASALMYSMLHLCGVVECNELGTPTGKPAVSMEDLRRFRQLGSKCAGHPEFGHVTGVEMTTGPLGQGVASSVGMAIALKWLAARYNRPNFTLFDADVYSLCGDGCMMEGISSEAASLAGTLALGNLCWIYDDNNITIEGDTELAFTEDVAQRFAAYRWNVVRVSDVNDLPALRKAVASFQKTSDKPTLIIVKSRIAFGAPKMEGSHEAHGAPLGDEEIRGAKEFFGLSPAETFAVSEDVYQIFRDGTGAKTKTGNCGCGCDSNTEDFGGAGIAARGNVAYQKWQQLFESYKKEYSDLAAELETMARGDLPAGWDTAVETFPTDPKGMASRISSGKVLNQVAKNLPWMLGGSADLAPSNKSDLTFAGAGEFSAETPAGRNFHFGVREHAMAAITNGMALVGLRPYCATFFVFADYMRPAIRLSSLMQLPAMYIYTHDSIGVGEDGPTHQPVEHLASLRAIPNLLVLRPADANEVAWSYKIAVQQKKTPSVLVFTRQNLPTIDRTVFASAEGTTRGGYILADSPTNGGNGKEKGKLPEVILIGTGSEVGLCLEAYEKLVAEGIRTRVVSMPCVELFEQQSQEYRDRVLPPEVTARVAVELGVQQGWDRYFGPKGAFLGIPTFGASGPAGTLMKHFGFTADNLCRLAKETIGNG